MNRAKPNLFVDLMGAVQRAAAGSVGAEAGIKPGPTSLSVRSNAPDSAARAGCDQSTIKLEITQSSKPGRQPAVRRPGT